METAKLVSIRQVPLLYKNEADETMTRRDAAGIIPSLYSVLSEDMAGVLDAARSLMSKEIDWQLGIG